MSILPMLFVDGDQAISNYVAAELSGIETGCSVCCPTIETLGFPPVVVEDQWWYDASTSASEDFHGAAVIPSTILLSKGWTAGGGGFSTTTSTAISPATRTLSMRVILRASTPTGLDYGIDVFARKIGVDLAGSRCATFAGAIYVGCDLELHRSFCAARVLDMVRLTGEEFDMASAGCVADVAAVFDVTIAIEDGCLWGTETVLGPLALRGETSTAELCNPGTIDPANACGGTFAVTSCAEIPDAYRCGPAVTVPTDPDSPICDAYCPPLFVARTVYEFTGLNPSTDHAPSFSIAAGAVPLTMTEVLVYPTAIFSDLGFDADADEAAAIGMCVEPHFRARLPYLDANTTVVFDGRCGTTDIDCGGDALPYPPEEIWSSSGVPLQTALDGSVDWTMIIDTRLDQPGGPLASSDASMSTCHRN